MRHASALRICGMALVACATTLAAAQLNPNPRNGPLPRIDPTTVELPGTLEWKPGRDPERYRPRLPDIDLKAVPPMPMPTAQGRTPTEKVDDTVTLYDATTNTAYRIPLAGTTLPNGMSEPSYTGVGPVVSEDQAWSGVMSSVTGASLSSYPARANVKLIMQFTDQNGYIRMFACSGSMQDGGVVLCAAHCVYARNPNSINIYRYADAVWVIPAWDGAGNNGFQDPAGTILQNYGWAVGTEYIAGSDYVNNGNSDRDCAAIRLNRAATRSVGMMTGWYGWSYGNCSTSTTQYNYSYPAEGCSSSLHTGRQMYLWNSTVDSCPGLFSNQFQLNTSPGCLTAVWGGMSGSGMYYISGGNRYVGAVASTSNRSTNGYYCALWQQFTTDLETFKSNTRGSVLDVEALQYRAGSSTPSVAQGGQIPAGGVLVSNATNNDPASRNYTVRVYLSSDSTISSADTLLATYSYTWDFGPMSNATFNIPATTIPYGTPTGTYYAGVIIDPGTDTNSSNNDTSLWDAQPVTVVPCTAPANDSCATPVVIADPETGGFNYDISQDTGCASTSSCEVADGCGSSSNSASVWYSFTPKHDGSINLNTYGSSYDTVMSIHSGCSFVFFGSCLQPSHLACNDDAGGTFQSAIPNFQVAAGSTYRIKISRYGVGLGGSLQFHLDYTPTAPANDACNAAFVIPVDSFSNTQDIFYATKASCENASPCISTEPTNNRSVWYSYRAPSDGTITVDTLGSQYDTILTIYNGCALQLGIPFPTCLRSTSLACNDDYGSLQSAIVNHPVTGGATYIFRVSAYGATLSPGSNLTFNLNFSPPPVPCAADFNGDGGVDGTDVVAFYDAWQNGDASADVNQDGGIDGSDINAFFTLWEAGGC